MLDDRTLNLLLDWLERRRNRWANTANLHLLINHQTAAMREQGAAPERPHIDRRLEELLTHGPDGSTSPRCSA